MVFFIIPLYLLSVFITGKLLKITLERMNSYPVDNIDRNVISMFSILLPVGIFLLLAFNLAPFLAKVLSTLGRLW